MMILAIPTQSLPARLELISPYCSVSLYVFTYDIAHIDVLAI